MRFTRVHSSDRQLVRLSPKNQDVSIRELSLRSLNVRTAAAAAMAAVASEGAVNADVNDR